MAMCRNSQQKQKAVELQSERNTAWFKNASQTNKSNADSGSSAWVRDDLYPYE